MTRTRIKVEYDEGYGAPFEEWDTLFAIRDLSRFEREAVNYADELEEPEVAWLADRYHGGKLVVPELGVATITAELVWHKSTDEKERKWALEEYDDGIEALIEAFLAEHNQWARGEVYRVVVEVGDECDKGFVHWAHHDALGFVMFEHGYPSDEELRDYIVGNGMLPDGVSFEDAEVVE